MVTPLDSLHVEAPLMARLMMFWLSCVGSDIPPVMVVALERVRQLDGAVPDSEVSCTVLVQE